MPWFLRTPPVQGPAAGKMDAWLELMEGEFIPVRGLARHEHHGRLPGARRTRPCTSGCAGSSPRPSVSAWTPRCTGATPMKNDIGPRVGDIPRARRTHRDAQSCRRRRPTRDEPRRASAPAGHRGLRAQDPRARAPCSSAPSRPCRAACRATSASFSPYPLYMATGRGCRTVDVDGSAYIDSFACNGPLLLGHRHAAVMASVERHAGVGSLGPEPRTRGRVRRETQGGPSRAPSACVS